MEGSLALVLAGGEGQRLYPLTRDRTKPSVPFAGKYRIIDFTLSNCINSGIRQVYVLTQYRSGSLNIHVQEAWGISSSQLEDFVYCIPAQQKVGMDWYRGTADAVRQNVDLIRNRKPSHILVLSGDHVYKMNYREMLKFHLEEKADLTLSAVRVKREEAGNFGVLQVDHNYRLIGFEEKPEDPKEIPEAPGYSLINMGIYIFSHEVLRDVLRKEGDDFGKHVIPQMLAEFKVCVYDYKIKNKIQDYVTIVRDGIRESILVDRTDDSDYWRDVGSIASYYDASMDLIGVKPSFNLYGQMWPFRTYQHKLPPSKFVLGGTAFDSIVSEGCIVSGGLSRRSILSPGVLLERDAVVEDSIVLDDVIVEPWCKIRRTIVDKNVIIRSGANIGYDAENDRSRGCVIDESGIVVIPKGLEIRPI